jgi:hypothetical protein
MSVKYLHYKNPVNKYEFISVFHNGRLIQRYEKLRNSSAYHSVESQGYVKHIKYYLDDWQQIDPKVALLELLK